MRGGGSVKARWVWVCWWAQNKACARALGDSGRHRQQEAAARAARQRTRAHLVGRVAGRVDLVHAVERRVGKRHLHKVGLDKLAAPVEVVPRLRVERERAPDLVAVVVDARDLCCVLCCVALCVCVWCARAAPEERGEDGEEGVGGGQGVCVCGACGVCVLCVCSAARALVQQLVVAC